jgi:glycosyltransferase involved in cell wall biosynthesis
MRVSVIVPTYNRAGLIGETLDSILGQSHKPEEVIVVDDGSTDETRSVVCRFPKPVKYLRIENSGESHARNVGVEASNSPYIAFCDSDDLWTRDKLALHARLFELAPDVRYSFSDFVIVQDGVWSKESKLDLAPPGFLDAPRREPEPGLMILDVGYFGKLLDCQPIFPSTLVMTREFFESAGRWNKALGRTRSQDLEFHLRCVVAPPIGVVRARVVGIRKHASNFSGDLVATEMGEIEILNYVLKNHPAASRYEDAIREQIVVRSANVANAAFSAGQLDLVRGALQAVPPRRRDWKLHLKGWVSGLPGPVARGLARVLLKTAAAPRQV